MRQILIFTIYVLIVVTVTTGAYHVLQQGRVSLAKGREFFRSDNYEKAINVFDSLQGGRYNKKALKWLGLARFYSGDAKGGLKAFEKYVKNAEADLEDYVTLLSLYRANNKWPEAIALGKSLVSRHPEIQRLRVMYARVLADADKIEKAIEQYKTALGENYEK